VSRNDVYWLAIKMVITKVLRHWNLSCS